MDGRKVRSTITAEANKFVHKQIGTPSSVTTRQFTEKELIVTLTAGDVTCTQKYTAEWKLNYVQTVLNWKNGTNSKD